MRRHAHPTCMLTASPQLSHTPTRTTDDMCCHLTPPTPCPPAPRACNNAPCPYESSTCQPRTPPRLTPGTFNHSHVRGCRLNTHAAINAPACKRARRLEHAILLRALMHTTSMHSCMWCRQRHTALSAPLPPQQQKPKPRRHARRKVFICA